MSVMDEIKFVHSRTFKNASMLQTALFQRNFHALRSRLSIPLWFWKRTDITVIHRLLENPITGEPALGVCHYKKISSTLPHQIL